MKPRRVLVVEDDAAIRRGIVDALGAFGYATMEAPDGKTGLEMATRVACDLILLDLVLPRGDGMEILAEVRRLRPTLPVIVLTARGDEDDRVAGLRGGADDYVVKPFAVRELIARIEAVLRRTPGRPSDVGPITVPGGVIDLDRCEMRFDDGSAAALSERERELVRYLASNAGRAVSREELLAHVWRMSTDGVETRTIDMHVVRLREKLRDDPAIPRVLLTVRGKGYKWCGPEPPR
jgi:DNA-binding response OmpR family regulator